ncbi:MAG: DHH family phosphoesterase [Spirochaetales bacterium]|nr:DHH family phosphoesterase [Spirochaetales bacterium]
MSLIKTLTEYLKNESHVYIQTHNFPDHDAVASAFGLQYILKQSGITSHIIYAGDIQRDSLKEMISALGIDIHHNGQHDLHEDNKIIIVDGCKGNKNVTDLTGDEIAVIDHHQVISPDNVLYTDIRPDFGACSSLIFGYFNELDLPVPRSIATALMIGIDMDTLQLTRNESIHDLEAYYHLYKLADIQLKNSILRNYIQTKDLKFYRILLDRLKIKNGAAYCYFDDGCNQNLLGILGDFLLALEEVDFVILCARNNKVINFSLRNERPDLNAAKIIQAALEGIGFGGGHIDMAGGVIHQLDLFNENEIHQKFLALL